MRKILSITILVTHLILVFSGNIHFSYDLIERKDIKRTVAIYSLSTHESEGSYVRGQHSDWFVFNITEGEYGDITSISVDSSDMPHISYCDRSLKYSWYDGNGWLTDIVDPKPNCDDSSLALDMCDRPHISYHHSEGKDLSYAWYDGQEWHIEIVDLGNTPYLGLYSSIALDSNNNPHISYFGDGYNQNYVELKYAYFNGTKWQTEVVDSDGFVGYYTSLVLDSNDRPHISYCDAGNGSLKYAHLNANQWHRETVDSGMQPNGTKAHVGASTSISLDSNDNVHISYFDNSNSDLKYAYYDRNEWRIETVDSSGWVGLDPCISLDSRDRPHISYYAYVMDSDLNVDCDLKYVHFDGYSWQIETIDSIGNVGGYSSLALDSYDHPHISYWDWGNMTLKYMTNNKDLNNGQSTEENEGRFSIWFQFTIVLVIIISILLLFFLIHKIKKRTGKRNEILEWEENTHDNRR